MTYVLGIDLGTTFTAASVGRNGRVEMLNLGATSTAIPSVVHIGASGEDTVGDAAVRRAVSDPDRVVMGYKRRLGDPVPLVVGGTPVPAHLIGARLLRWVVARAVEREGEEPERIVVTHPANWGGYKREYFTQLLEAADVGKADSITEPEAAAIAYAASNRIEPGEIVPVYDLGGGTFDVAILRRTTSGFELVGKPHGIEQLGGLDFDAALFAFVIRELDIDLAELDEDDPSVVSAVQQLRHDVVSAKITLSSDVEATISVLIPGRVGQVRITRSEFEELVEPLLAETVESVRRAIAGAELKTEDLGRVLLVGGSSRIPLVAQLVMSAFERPIAVDADPKHLIARGAAHHGLGSIQDDGVLAAPDSTAPPPPPPPPPAPAGGEEFQAVQLSKTPPPAQHAALPVENEETSTMATEPGQLPLGFIVFDDGSTFILDNDYVIGRDAGSADAVRAGAARPLVLVDPDASVSRVHAVLNIENGVANISDQGSTNGTYVWDEANECWEQLVPWAVIPLSTGAKVAIGQRTFVFEPID